MEDHSRFTHNIPPSRERKEIISSSGNIWFNSTFFIGIERARRERGGVEQWDRKRFLTKRKQE